jgi:hypothetical protein
MPLSFVVGDAVAAFGDGFGAAVNAVLRKRFPSLASSDADPYSSDEVDVNGWRALQKRVAQLMQAPQITAIDVYLAVYVPLALDKIEELPVPNAADPLQIGSVDALMSELRDFAVRVSLPTDDVELMQLGIKYLEDEELFDADLDVQTYVQLMLSAKQAVATKQPLWVKS